jgi:predicted nucleotidyltransferase
MSGLPERISLIRQWVEKAEEDLRTAEYMLTMVDSTVKKCREILEEHYGDRFAGLVLYGSSARGDADSASDIDLLVLLHKPFDYFLELRILTDLIYSLQLESERLLSIRPAAVDEFESGSIQFYRNALREGVNV